MLPHSWASSLGNFPTVPKLSGTKINKPSPPPLTTPPKMADFTKFDMCVWYVYVAWRSVPCPNVTKSSNFGREGYQKVPKHVDRWVRPCILWDLIYRARSRSHVAARTPPSCTSSPSRTLPAKRGWLTCWARTNYRKIRRLTPPSTLISPSAPSSLSSKLFKTI